jgi:quercetin 2,3-dioxygenase
MIEIRKAKDRGHFDHGWLKTFHTFSFGDYLDPEHTSFRSLRVMNEDWVMPGRGFGTHPHRDMEIVTYVLEGALEHKDSMGNGSVLRPGEFQRMSAGTGITHSEFNPSPSEPVHLYQIWLFPERKGIQPGYEQRAFDASQRQNRLQLVASQEGRDNALTIHQDADVFLSTLQDGAITHALRDHRHAWLQVLRGSVLLNGQQLDESDGAAISEESQLTIESAAPSEIMLFDMVSI